MKNRSKLLALVALSPLLVACKPSPEKICTHVTDLAKKSAPEGTEEPSEDDMKDHTDKCVKRLDTRKSELGEEAYQEMVKCVMDAKDMEGVVKCDEPQKQGG